MKDKLKKVFLVIIIIIIIIAIFAIKKKSSNVTQEYKTPSVAYPVEILNNITEENIIYDEEKMIDIENTID
jgi:cell shape-determining protein MreC